MSVRTLYVAVALFVAVPFAAQTPVSTPPTQQSSPPTTTATKEQVFRELDIVPAEGPPAANAVSRSSQPSARATRAFDDGSTAVVPSGGLGFGYDTIEQKVLGSTCVNVEAPIVTASPGQGKNFNIALVTDKRQLAQVLNGSVSGSWFLGSAGLDFANQYSRADTTLSLVARASVAGPAQVWRITKLTDEAKQLLASNPEQFRRACGTKFISGFDYESRYFGLIRVEATSASEYSMVSGRLSHGTGFFSGKAEVSQRLSQSLEGLKYEVTISKAGGAGSRSFVPFQDTPEKLITEMWHWLDSVNPENAIASRMLLRDYSSIIEAVPLLPSSDTIDRQEDFIADAGERYAVCDTARRRMERLLALATSNEEREKLRPRVTTAISTRDAIYAKAADCRSDATKCVGEVPQCEVADYAWWPQCAKPIYAQGTGGPCGQRSKSGQGEVCGWSGIFREGTGPECGVKSYKRNLIGHTGVEITGRRVSELLGEPYNPPTKQKCTGFRDNRECRDVPDERCHAAWENDKAKRACPLLSTDNVIYYYRPYCRNLNEIGNYSCDAQVFENLPETYHTCRHANFGKEFNTCEHSSFGSDDLTCRHPAFGIERCDQEASVNPSVSQ